MWLGINATNKDSSYSQFAIFVSLRSRKGISFTSFEVDNC